MRSPRVGHDLVTEQQQCKASNLKNYFLPSLTYECSKSLPSKLPACKFSSPSVFLRTQPMTKHIWLKCIYFPVFPGRESRLINVALTWYSIIFCCSWEKICSSVNSLFSNHRQSYIHPSCHGVRIDF